MERTGTSETGAITSFYSVLVEGDDMTEPVTDTVRSILDGHIFLSRDLADANHFPAIDVLGSVSRVMSQVVSADHQELARQFRGSLAVFRQNMDLINIGAYAAGSSAEIDRAIALQPEMNRFLRQPPDESVAYAETADRLALLLEEPEEVESAA